MSEELDRSNKQVNQDLNGLKNDTVDVVDTAGRAAGRIGSGVKRIFHKGSGAAAKTAGGIFKKLKDGAKKILKAFVKMIMTIIAKIIALGPIGLAIIVGVAIFLGAYYIWYMGDRGTAQSKSLRVEDENVTVISEETGAVTAVAMSETQALIDAYYKFMSCQSYVKYYNGIELNFEDDTDDFSMLTDYYSAEKDYYLSHNFIYMADEVLHQGEFSYPEHIVMPVKHEVTTSETTGDTIVQTVPLDKDGYVKSSDVRETGLGSVLAYKPGTKDYYVDAVIASFDVDFDLAITAGESVTYSHYETRTYNIVNSATGVQKSASEVISEIDSDIDEINKTLSPNQSCVAHYPDVYAMTGETTDYYSRTVDGVTTKFSITHMPQTLLGEDKDIDAMVFSASELADFNVDKGNGLYPVTVPLVTSAATFSGNIEYEYENVVSYNELADGSNENIYEPVKEWVYETGCKAPTESTKYGTAVKQGNIISTVPILVAKTPDPDQVTQSSLYTANIDRVDGEFSGNPWGYEYFDVFVNNYSANIPASAQDDIAERLKKDENAMDLVKQLGLLREYTGASSLEAVGEFTQGDLELLARIIYHEAGSNKLDQLLVGSVVMNRVASDWFPDTILEVLNGYNQYPVTDRWNVDGEDISDEIWTSAWQVLNGEFTIPANVIGQAAFNQYDGYWLINQNGSGENTHWYTYKGSSVSEVDRFNRTAISASQAQSLADTLAQTVKTDITKTNYYERVLITDDGVQRPQIQLRSGASVSSSTLSGATSEQAETAVSTVASSGETLYAVTPFNVIDATNIIAKVAKPEDNFFGALKDFLFSGENSIFSILKGVLNMGEDSTDTETHVYNLGEINDADVRRIVYQAVTLDESITYESAKTQYQNIRHGFLFMGDKTEDTAAKIVSYVGSTLSGWISPTDYALTPKSTNAGASGLGVELSGIEGDPVLALSDGEVTNVTYNSVTILYEPVDGVTYQSVYTGLTIDVAVGTKVSKGDTVAHIGISNSFIFEFYDGAQYIAPMIMFYQTVVISGGDDIVEVATNELNNFKANPYSYDTLKYQKELGGGSDVSTAWCAYFVSWCVKQIYPDVWTSASCGAMLSHYRNGVDATEEEMALWEDGPLFGGSYTPQPGDIVLFNFNYMTNGSGHTGIVIGTEGNKVVTIEGNSDTKIMSAFGMRRQISMQEYNKTGRSPILGYIKLSTLG